MRCLVGRIVAPNHRSEVALSALSLQPARRFQVRWRVRTRCRSRANAERAAKAIQDKLARLDEAFLFERSIDIETYDRHAEKRREELTLARIERHSGQLEELDVEGIPSTVPQLFFPDGIAFDGNGFVRTPVTAPAFSYLRPIESENEGLVGAGGIEPPTPRV
jgi:hypothetical protein